MATRSWLWWLVTSWTPHWFEGRGHARPVGRSVVRPGGCGRWWCAPGRTTTIGSGLEGGIDVLVDVFLGHHRRVELDLPGHLVVDEVRHALLLRQQPGDTHTVGGLARGVDHGRLDDAVAVLDMPHHVGRTRTADHEELVAAGVVDGREHSHALIVVVVPDRIDLRCRLQQVRGRRLAALHGE